MERRLEDRIQQLCKRVVASQDTREMERLCSELREALAEHASRLREKVKAYPIARERRSNDEKP